MPSPVTTGDQMPSLVQALQAKNEALFIASKTKEAALSELAAQGPAVFRLPKPASFVTRAVIRFVPPLRKMWHRRLIAQSGLFDAQWYLQTNPDVRDSGANPLRHFLAWGGKDRRDPSVHFSSGAYLDLHADVAASGVNPLVHFLTQGWQEQRATRKSLGQQIVLEP